MMNLPTTASITVNSATVNSSAYLAEPTTRVRVAAELRSVATLRAGNKGDENDHADGRLPSQRVLEGALSFVGDGTVDRTPAYRLSVTDASIMVRPTDPARLAQLDRYSQATVMRLGETLTYAQAQIRQCGFASAVELLPVKNRIDPLATITVGEPIVPARVNATAVDESHLASVVRQDVPLVNRSIPVPVLAQFDLAAQAEGVWAYAAKALELLPTMQPNWQMAQTLGAGVLDFSAESALLVLYTEGNSLRDWLLVGRAIARIRQIGYPQHIGARMLHHSVAAKVIATMPWRQTLRFNQLQAVLQLGHYADE